MFCSGSGWANCHSRRGRQLLPGIRGDDNLKLSRHELAEIRRNLSRQPLTPIPCAVCGWVGVGRYANRSTVCWRCRRKRRA